MTVQKKQEGITIFFSYVQADQIWCEQLASHLSQLKHDGLIEEWSDQQIPAGSDRTQFIDQALSSARVILLLISADFLASDAKYLIEMQQALERHLRGKACVIPIIVRQCDWQHSPFADLQCLPRNGKPITSWDNPDEAFTEVAKNIRRIVKALSTLKVSSPPSVHTFPHTEDNSILLDTQAQRQTEVTTLPSPLLKLSFLLRFPRWRRHWRIILLSMLLVVVMSISSFIAFTNYLSTPMSTPLKTLQFLCSTDYPKQWSLFSLDTRKSLWNNDESVYISGLRGRGSVTHCTITEVIQNGSTASGKVTEIFHDGKSDPKTFQLAKEADGIWRIDSISSQ